MEIRAVLKKMHKGVEKLLTDVRFRGRTFKSSARNRRKTRDGRPKSPQGKVKVFNLFS